jgi:hypothetical protein
MNSLQCQTGGSSYLSVVGMPRGLSRQCNIYALFPVKHLVNSESVEK